jgi:hypothetical protein
MHRLPTHHHTTREHRMMALEYSDGQEEQDLVDDAVARADIRSRIAETDRWLRKIRAGEFPGAGSEWIPPLERRRATLRARLTSPRTPPPTTPPE